jgi:hypothetical protein
MEQLAFKSSEMNILQGISQAADNKQVAVKCKPLLSIS